MSTIKDEAIKLRQNIDNVYEAGKKAELDTIMEAWQQGGRRKNYIGALGYLSTDFIYPKYDICPEGDASYFARQSAPPVIDLVERLNECGVKMDFSKVTNPTYLFYAGCFSHLPEINLTGVTYGSHTLLFGNWVVTIDKLILSPNGTNIKQAFGYAEKLENVVIEGCIGGGDLEVKYSPKLTLASLKSILTALKDYSGTANEFSYTVSLLGENWAVLEADGATAPNGMTWVEYVGSKGWNKA